MGFFSKGEPVVLLLNEGPHDCAEAKHCLLFLYLELFLFFLCFDLGSGEFVSDSVEAENQGSAHEEAVVGDGVCHDRAESSE